MPRLCITRTCAIGQLSVTDAETVVAPRPSTKRSLRPSARMSLSVLTVFLSPSGVWNRSSLSNAFRSSGSPWFYGLENRNPNLE
jgi:hypothetical protein